MDSKSKQDDDYQQRIKNLAEEAHRNSYLEKKGININEPIILYDLFPDTIFGDDYRVMPNEFARSCLFTVRHPSVERKTYLREEIYHINENITILYTGQELRAVDDELIWMQLIQYCLKSPLDSCVEFKIRQLILDIGWKPTGAYYKKVRDSLSRMKATEIYVQNSKAFGKSASISLIGNYIASENSSTDNQPTVYRVSIDKNLAVLFAGNTFTNIPWDKFKRLSVTSRRLVDYAFSNKFPFSLPVDKFLKMCGSDRINSPQKTKTLAATKCCNELVQKDLVKEAKVIDGKIVIVRK